MNVEIRDSEVFNSLEPEAFIRYLKLRGWQEKKSVPDEIAIYELTTASNDSARLWVPLSRKFSDYVSVMSSAFKSLADTEHRSQLALLNDLQTQSIGDVLRVGSEDSLSPAVNSLPLSQGILLHEQARQMALAGAWNAISGNDRKPVYPQSMRSEIERYMHSLRLAQTERGSFVIRLISPIGETDQWALFSDLSPRPPFERRAIIELLSGLKALWQVAHDSIRRGEFDFRAFEESVMEGVSANLCDAVAPTQSSDQWRPLFVSVSWCDVIPPPNENLTTELVFEPPLLQHIRVAASEFRKRNPVEVKLQGLVTALERGKKKSQNSGEIKIYGVVNDRARYIKTTLNRHDYDLAVDAHKNYRTVSVSGTLLAKSVGFWRLENPVDFHLVETAQGEEPQSV
jgi:hypothetical protein